MKFEIVETGGNCKAYYLNLGGYHLVVTDNGGTGLPESGDEFFFGVYAPDDEGWSDPLFETVGIFK